jgi:hypothetical protein
MGTREDLPLRMTSDCAEPILEVVAVTTGTGAAGLDWLFANASEVADLLIGQETVN